MRRTPDERTHRAVPELLARVWKEPLSTGQPSETDGGVEANHPWFDPIEVLFLICVHPCSSVAINFRVLRVYRGSQRVPPAPFSSPVPAR